jgi:hypothetical protein
MVWYVDSGFDISYDIRVPYKNVSAEMTLGSAIVAGNFERIAIVVLCNSFLPRLFPHRFDRLDVLSRLSSTAPTVARPSVLI